MKQDSQVEVERLLARWCTGDEAAAQQIFDRYVDRLVNLARSRLSPKMLRRLDPEDIVQSTFRSFFERAKEGDFRVDRSGDLWRLLAAITVNKVLKHVEHHSAKKRTIDDEASVREPLGEFHTPPELVAREPTPAEATGLMDEMRAFADELAPTERQILVLRLQDRSSEEIADALFLAPQTVRRKLQRLRQLLAARLGQ